MYMHVNDVVTDWSYALAGFLVSSCFPPTNPSNVSVFFYPDLVSICVIVELCSTTDVRDKDNRTPLHYSCVGGSKYVVQYLVEELKMDVGEIYCDTQIVQKDISEFCTTQHIDWKFIPPHFGGLWESAVKGMKTISSVSCRLPLRSVALKSRPV